jgi:hypothetical protein
MVAAVPELWERSWFCTQKRGELSLRYDLLRPLGFKFPAGMLHLPEDKAVEGEHRSEEQGRGQ